MSATEHGTFRVRDDVTIRADRDRLACLLENLFRSSIGHGTAEPDDENVTVEVEVDTVEDGSGTTDFYVADDGPGTPEAKRGSRYGALPSVPAGTRTNLG